MASGDHKWRYHNRSAGKHPDDLVCATCGQALQWIDSDKDHLLHARPDLNNCPVRIPWDEATTRKNLDRVRSQAARIAQRYGTGEA